MANLEERLRKLEKTNAKAKAKHKQEISAALWGAVGAWAWTTIGKPVLDKIPFWWKVIGGLLLSGVLAVVARMPELAWPIFIGTLGLVAYRIVGGKREHVAKPAKIVRDWSQTVAENDTLSKALRGSTAKVVAQDEHGFTVEVTLTGGRTFRDVAGVEANLESVFTSTVTRSGFSLESRLTSSCCGS